MKSVSYLSIKYMVDRPLAFFLFILAVPFMLIFAVLVALELKTFPFIVQSRGLALKSSRIKIYKFRTIKKHSINITVDVKSIFDKHFLESYVPPFCRWLRRTGLDELPQLLNVISSEMSLVGPRPLTLTDLIFIKDKDSCSYEDVDKLTVKPGMTGFWQVKGSRWQGVANIVWLQKFYNLNITFLLDVKIFLSTLPLIFFREHTDTIVVREFGGRNGKLVRSFSPRQ